MYKAFPVILRRAETDYANYNSVMQSVIGNMSLPHYSQQSTASKYGTVCLHLYALSA